MSLKFEFIQPGEFEDPYYDVINKYGETIAEIKYFDDEWWLWQTNDGFVFDSLDIDQISAKLKQLNN